MSEAKIVIVGAGISGLALGRLLPGSVIYEKSPFIGGTSRTLRYKDFYFDLGLHYLSGLDSELEEFLKPFLGKDLSEIPSSKRNWACLRKGRFWRGLARPRDVPFWSNPFLRSALEMSHYFRKAFPRKGGSYQDSLINLYGDFYYQLFMNRFVEKNFRIPVDQIFMPGFRPRKRESVLIRLLRRILKGKRQAEQTWDSFYPLPWFGVLAEKLAEGLEIHLSSELTRIQFVGNRVTQIEINHNQAIPCDHLVLTVPPQFLIDLFDPPPEIREQALALRYRALICVVLFFETSRVMNEYWIQALGEEIFSQAFEPKNWSPEMSPPHKTSVCFEIFCLPNDPVWQMPDSEMIKRVFEDFSHYYHVPDPTEGIVIRIPRVWPIFDSQFEANFKAVHQFASSFENIHFPNEIHFFQGNLVNTAVKEALRLSREIKNEETVET